MVGCVFSHLCSAESIFSIVGVQILSSCVLFSIHAPSILFASPSLAIDMSCWIADWLRCSFHVSINLFQYLSVSTEMISVLEILNFTPDALHQLSSIVVRSSKLSSSVRYTVVLSAKSETMVGSAMPGAL